MLDTKCVPEEFDEVLGVKNNFCAKQKVKSGIFLD